MHMLQARSVEPTRDECPPSRTLGAGLSDDAVSNRNWAPGIQADFLHQWRLAVDDGSVNLGFSVARPVMEGGNRTRCFEFIPGGGHAPIWLPACDCRGDWGARTRIAARLDVRYAGPGCGVW